MSKVYNDFLWDWYSDTFRTRINPQGMMIWTMTRWHDQDILARLIKQAKENPEADQFIHVNLPAIIEEEDPEHDYYQNPETMEVVQVEKNQPPQNTHSKKVFDLLGREMGDALLPSRYSKEQLLRIKASVTMQTWHSLHQGRPIADFGRMFKTSWKRKIFLSADGAFFEWFDEGVEPKRVEVAECRYFQFCDPSIKKGTESDYTAIATIVLTPKNQIIVYDMYRAQISGHEVYDKAVIERQKHPKVQATYMEDKVSGTLAIEIGKEKGLPMKALKAEENKIIRAAPLEIQYQNGNVFHFSGRATGTGSYYREPAWVSVYESELFEFPLGKHDDQVDAVAHCAKAMLEEAKGVKNHGLLGGYISTESMIKALPDVENSIWEEEENENDIWEA
jgi:predicted phage terminase large subunit-like protein